MIRTLRNGCLLTTVAASSCTDTDAEIRFTSDARIPMNSTSDPHDASPSSLSDGDGGHNSAHSTPSVFGSAVNTTPTPSTMATSSSCEMPASSAADSSSRLMENEIVNDRSDPRLDSDSDIAALYPSTVARTVGKKSVVDACRESVGFEIDARSQILVVRRLLVTPRAARHPLGFRKTRGRARVTSYSCEAGIFGTTFANLSHICRNNGKVPPAVLRAAMYDALMPVAKNFRNMAGPDVKHLARGLGSHRVLRPQFPKLIEAQIAPPIQRRDGHPACAFGAAAAILVLFHVLARDTTNLELGGALDAGGLGTQLEKVLEATAATLADWPLQEALDAAALCAEQRALQRAYVGVRLARACDVQNESIPQQFARRLDFYAQCAWPAGGRVLGRATHHATLDAIASGEVANDEWVREDNCFLSPMVDDDSVVPLSALHAGDGRGGGGPLPGGGADDYRDDDASSSVTYTTSPSTLASTAASSADDDDPADAVDPVQFVASHAQDALRVAHLAIAAATAALPGPSPSRTPDPPAAPALA